MTDSTSPSTSAPTTPQTSHTFPRLPSELRLKIFLLAITSTPSRTLTIKTKWHRPLGGYRNLSHYSIRIPNRTPPLLHACSMSRLEALKIWTPMFGVQLGGKPIFFAPEVDVLQFEDQIGKMMFLRGRVVENLDEEGWGEEDWGRVRFVRVRVWERLWMRPYHVPWMELSGAFGGLRKLTFGEMKEGGAGSKDGKTWDQRECGELWEEMRGRMVGRDKRLVGVRAPEVVFE